LLSLLIRNQRRVPQSTLAEAHQVVKSSGTNALIMLAVIPVGDVIVWLFREGTVEAMSTAPVADAEPVCS
jgi:hypothetical protein